MSVLGPEPGRTSRCRRALAAFALLAAVGSAGACEDPAVRRIAARELSCPEREVGVNRIEESDTSERYAVSGCGKKGLLACTMPDLVCSFESVP